MAKELLKREEVKVEDTWKVEDMYATAADWEKDLELIKGITEKMVSLEGKIGESAKNLLQILEWYAHPDHRTKPGPAAYY